MQSMLLLAVPQLSIGREANSKASYATACRGDTDQSALCAAVSPLPASLRGTVTLCTTQSLSAAKCDLSGCMTLLVVIACRFRQQSLQQQSAAFLR